MREIPLCLKGEVIVQSASFTTPNMNAGVIMFPLFWLSDMMLSCLLIRRRLYFHSLPNSDTRKFPKLSLADSSAFVDRPFRYPVILKYFRPSNELPFRFLPAERLLFFSHIRRQPRL